MLAMVRNVVRASFRNRVALFFTIGLAIFLMVIFGLAFGGTGPSLSIAVVDQDRSALSTSYVQTLQNVPGITVETGTLQEEQDRLKKDKISLLELVPTGFGSAAAARRTAAITVFQNADQSQTASVALNVVNSVTEQFARQSLGQAPGVLLSPPQSVSTNNVTALDFILPSMLAYVVVQSGINFVAIGLVDQRQRKVLRRFLATPLRPWQILGGNIGGATVTVLLQAIALVAVGLIAFQAHLHGNPLLATAIVLLGTATFVSIGFLLCAAARTSESARGLATAVAFPMLFLSGVFIPLDVFPQVMQNAVHVLPLTYFTEALHAVLNDGDGLTGTVLIDMVVLSAWAAVCFALATWRFRWE